MIEGNEVFGFYRVFVALFYYYFYRSVDRSSADREEQVHKGKPAGISPKQKFKNHHDIEKGTDDNENRTRILRQPCF